MLPMSSIMNGLLSSRLNAKGKKEIKEIITHRETEMK